jgi:uncharacterized protein with von Willebrand factor type A (vWA) domain
MGLIQFVEEVGRRLEVGDTPPAQSAQASVAQPGPDAREAAALVRLVEQMGLPVKHLGIQVDGERATPTGTTDSQETREKLVRLVGNVQGVGQVDDQLQVAQPAPAARFYTVKRERTRFRRSRKRTPATPIDIRGSSRPIGRCSGTLTNLPGADAAHPPMNADWAP